ncbi:MAG: hypothetical protein J6N22_00340, partial [Schwartzia sp.]|nr:hypothetical protein [Schwartzia sp. (in: firmicutes)]
RLMKNMTARDYLKIVRQICTAEEAAGRCTSGEEQEKICPLWNFGCGVPKEPEDIDTLIEIALNYKVPPEGACWKCGADIKEMRKQGIKYCPFCGGELKE